MTMKDPPKLRASAIGMLGRLRERNVRFMTERLRERGYGDFAPSHGTIVNALRTHGPLRMSELADIAEKRRPTITVLVKKLAQHGLVETREDDEDQRVVRVHLLPAGRRFEAAVRAIARESVAKATRDVAPEDQATFLEVLTRLLHNFDDYK